MFACQKKTHTLTATCWERDRVWGPRLRHAKGGQSTQNFGKTCKVQCRLNVTVQDRDTAESHDRSWKKETMPSSNAASRLA